MISRYKTAASVSELHKVMETAVLYLELCYEKKAVSTHRDTAYIIFMRVSQSRL